MIEDQQPPTPESYATRLEYNAAEGHWGPAKVSVASTLGDRDPSEKAREIGQEDHSSILSETVTKPLTMQRSLGRSTFLYKVGEDIEEQANQYFDHRGKVSWVICDFPDGLGSTNEGIIGHIKGMYYYEHDTWVLILTALQSLVPSYALPNYPSETRDARRGLAPWKAVKLPEKNIHILLQFQGSALNNLEKRVDELESDILGNFTAKITGVARSALRDRIDRLWTRVEGQIPRVHGQELSPSYEGKRAWKMY
jgi:hypothetical protein